MWKLLATPASSVRMLFSIAIMAPLADGRSPAEKNQKHATVGPVVLVGAYGQADT